MNKDHTISILIIEDNPGDQLLLHENLISTGLHIAEIIMVETLAEGIAYLSKHNSSLIFLDLFLSDSTGLDSFTELIKINSRIPIIIYSGLSDTKVALKAIASGAQDFLIKGDYTVSLLEKAVRYSIERKISSEALEESNERYNLISRATHDMVWDWDLVTGEVYRNAEGWKKIFRATGIKKFGKKEDWPLRVHPDDREKVKQIIERVIESEDELFETECRILRDDGTIGYIIDRGYIIRNGSGKAIRLIGATRDITDRKKAERNLLLSEQRFKSLVQNSSDLLAILDSEGNYTYVSPTSKKILGIEPEFFIGKNAFSFMHEDDIPMMSEFFADKSFEAYVEAPIFRLRNNAGEWRWIESSITNLMDDAAVKGIVVNSKDITEKKLAEDELRKLSLIAKETINGVVIRDKDHNVVWVNNAFTKMYGYELAEVIGKNPVQFLKGDETNGEMVKLINSKLTKKETFVFEIFYYTKEREKLCVSIQIQPMFDENGEMKQSFAMHTDITEQKRLEEQVELEKLIKQKQITEAVFTAQENERSEIGRELHDNVNQLLGAIKLYIDMARKDDVNRDDLLVSSSAYTLTAIDEIRKLSKTLITPLIRDIGLADSIKDITEGIMHVHPVKIVFAANDFIECGLSEKFKLNIFRIVQEQINNILKHAKASTITITIEDKNDKISVSIKDDGIGFDTSRRKTGVGLTNIKSRSELFNGKVLLTSEQGVGTRLALCFDKNELLQNNISEINN